MSKNAEAAQQVADALTFRMMGRGRQDAEAVKQIKTVLDRAYPPKRGRAVGGRYCSQCGQVMPEAREADRAIERKRFAREHQWTHLQSSEK